MGDIADAVLRSCAGTFRTGTAAKGRDPESERPVVTLFPKWMNKLPAALVLGGLFGAVGIVGAFWYYATPKFWRVGYQPVQPGGGFNHQIHAGKLGMDCRYCHTKIETSAEANIPNVATCQGCHAEGRLMLLATNEQHKQKTEFIRTAYEADASIPWTRVHKLPDYVRNFPHDAHLKAGVSCLSCHGRIDTMPVVHHAQPLSMSWCLDCHRAPERQLLEDRTRVTDLAYAEGRLGELGQVSGEQAREILRNREIVAPQNCGACHH